MHKRPRRALVSAQEVARSHGIDERTVRRWVKAGLPVARAGTPGHEAPRFDADVVARWVERNANDADALTGALCRRLDALSRGAAATLAQLLRDNLPAGEVERAWESIHTHIVARLMRAAGEWARDRDLVSLAEAKDLVKYEAALERRARDLLQELAAGTWIRIQRPTGTASERVPVVQTSRTVRQARAQLAELQALVIDVRGRIRRGPFVQSRAVV